MKKKLLQPENILSKINFLKNNKKSIVLCHGVFDLFHIGHLRHLQLKKKKEIIYLLV